MFIGSVENLNKLRNKPLLLMNNKPIKRVRKSKSLGVIIDEKLTWSEHIDSVAKKICVAISGLRQARRFVLMHVAMTIYNSLIKLLFDYCNVVWNNTSCGNTVRMQKLQNRAARVIAQEGFDIRFNEIRNKLN